MLKRRSLQIGLAGLLAWGLWPALSLAHNGQPLAPHDFWTAWTWAPILTACFLLLGWAYAIGLRNIWRRVGVGRCVKRWQATSFFAGLLTVAIALLSPLDALGETLFSAHMVQHLLLLVVAAPLLVLGRPLIPLLWVPAKPQRRALGRLWHKARFIRGVWGWVSQPLGSWILYAVVIWVWHLPTLYQAALATPWIHEVEHFSFLSAALLFWWVLLQPHGSRRLGHGGALLQVFTTALHNGALGALLSFSQTPIYPIYQEGVAAWGLTLLTDQQLAGLIMWIPASFIYLTTLLLLVANWLTTSEQQAQQYERRVWVQP